MAHLLILGARSGIGLAAAKAAIAGGHRVRAFSRRADATPIADPHIELFAGDATEPDDLGPALRDIDAVVYALGVPFNLQLLLGPIDLFSTSTARLLPAMQAASVQRLMVVTGFGAGDSAASIHPLQRAGFNLVFGRAYADKSKQEALIRATDLNWTIVRPGVLTNRPLGAYQVLYEPQEWRNGLVSRSDVANYLVTHLEDSTTFGRTPTLVR